MHSFITHLAFFCLTSESPPYRPHTVLPATKLANPKLALTGRNQPESGLPHSPGIWVVCFTQTRPRPSPLCCTHSATWASCKDGTEPLSRSASETSGKSASRTGERCLAGTRGEEIDGRSQVVDARILNPVS